MRGKALLAVLSLVAVAWPAVGQVKGPAEVTIPVGKLTPLTLTIEGDASEYVILGSDYFGGFREFTPPTEFRFQLLGYTPGTGHVVVSAVKGGKLQPLYTCRVTVPAALVAAIDRAISTVLDGDPPDEPLTDTDRTALRGVLRQVAQSLGGTDAR